MKKIITLIATGLSILSAGGAWAWYSGGSDNDGSGSHDGGAGGVIYYPPTTTTGGGTTTVTPIATATVTPVVPVTPVTPVVPIVAPSVTPSAVATPSASPIVYGVLRPCPTPVGTVGAVQPTSSPSSTASPSAIPQCINVSIPANAPTLGTAAYGINPLAVPVNTTVTWVNNDTVNHTVTSSDGSFDSGVIAPGQSFSVTFVADGLYNYFCSIHGAAAMSGSVQVGAAPSPSPSITASPVATVTPIATQSPGVSGGTSAGDMSGA